MGMDENRQERQRRAALHQALFRQINEELNKLHEDSADTQFVCECWVTLCDVPVSLALDEYEEVRKCPTHFFVAPGHVNLEVERIVRQTERYQVVEKIGLAAKVAERVDPRAPRH